MNRHKLLAGLLLLALLGILFSAGGLGPIQSSSGLTANEMAGSATAGWGGDRNAYRSDGSRDSASARSRDAYRR